MAETKTLTFEQLWSLATSVIHGGNGLYYHPCCDIWTTRGSITKRSSHSKSLHWRKLLSTLDKSIDDKKQALFAKMTKEDWRLPALLNETCHPRARPTLQPQSAFELHYPDQIPQDLQASLAPQYFAQARPDDSPNQAISMLYLYQFSNDNFLPLFKSKPTKQRICYPVTTPRNKTTFST